MSVDKLQVMMRLQEDFMQELKRNDKMPEWPVDLTTKPGQRLIKETIFNAVEELCEASFTLKNRMHKISDDRSVDFPHYLEELGDTLAYFLEICILSGITPEMLYDEYCRKNDIVKKRLKSGY